MQKRVVYNFNAQTATGSAAKNSTGKAVKASNAISKIKRAFSGKSIKLAVLVVLLFVSLFCTIGSADWIISQQKNVPNSQDGSANATFKFNDLGLNNHIEIPNVAFSGNPAQANFLKTAPNSGRDLPDEVEQSIKQSIKYKVKPYNQTSAQSRVFRAPKNAAASIAKNMAPAAYANETLPDEKFFADSEWTDQLPTEAGTYAVLIISKVGEVSYGKAIKVFTIAPCPVRIVWSGNQNFTYDGTAHPITATAYEADENGPAITEKILSISLTYKAPGADPTAATTVSEVKNAGTYTAKATITNDNYVIAAGNQATFTVEKKALTVTADNKTVTYGEPAPAYAFSCDGLVSTDSPASLGTPEFNCAYTSTSTVEGSPYEIKVSGLTNSNYNINYVSGKLTVNKRELTLNWGTTSFVYDGEAQTPNPTVNNAVTGDDLGLTVTITGENITGSPASAINVGTYTATAAITNNNNYVIAADNQTATFNITARELTVKANDNTITYGSAPATNGYVISGFTNGETYTSTEVANIGGKVELTTTYTQYGNTGEYDIKIDISGLSSPNYSFKAENGKLTVNKKELTVTANDHQITYGEEPSANGYKISGFVGIDNESVITGLENITYIIDYNQWQDIGKFSITPKVDGLSATNYSFKANSGGILTVLALEIQLSGTIKRNYASGGIPYNKDLFSEATFTAPSNPAIDLSKLPNPNIYTYISGAGEAKNFVNNNGVAETAENGLFSYKFGETIKAGSTYKIDSVTLNNKNLKLTKTEVYLKYQTAKIGTGTNAKFFTIEDALAESGDIILASDSSGTDTYVISAFTSLNYYGGKTFTCSKNIIVPHADGTTTFEHELTSKTGNVGSVLIIPNGVSLTMDSSSLNILAAISQNGTVNTCTAASRGVVMNQGTLTVTGQIGNGSTPNILAYGYLKGNGNVIVENGATVEDLFHLYDFKGGGMTYGIRSKTEEYLPINSYSIHNISCNVRVNTGCVYNTFYEITMGGKWFSGIIPVVSTADSAALFKLSSGYIEKRAIPAESATWKNKKDSAGITYGESLDKIKGSNQLAGQKEDIRIYGTTVDGKIKISATLAVIFSVNMETGTNNPLPVPYMDIRVCNGGDLSLVNSSYKFMPGSSLTVDDGGKLTLGANAKLVLYSVEDCSVLEAPATYKEKDGTIKDYPYSFITRYCIDKVDAYLSINSNNITLNGGVSGKIISEKSGVKLEIKKDSTDITVLNVVINNKHALASFEYADVTTRNASSARPMKPCGDIMNSSSTAAESYFEAGTYYSANIGSDSAPVYAWFKNSATITYNPNGGTLNGTSGNTTQNVTLPSGGYTALPTPTRVYYEFGGWYYDNGTFSQQATAIFTDCTLYAKWTPIQYTIIYNLPYAECGTLADGSLSGTEVKTLTTPPQTITVDGTEYTFGDWYLNSEYMGDPITEVSAANATGTIINVYAFYRGGTYTVNYNENPDPDNITFSLTVEKPASQVFDKGLTVSSSELHSLNDYNNNTSFNYYFAGWYLSTDSNKTIISSLPNTIDGDITLCALWVKKALLKIELPVFENGIKTENTTIYNTNKYFYNQKLTVGIDNLSEYIASVYTVPGTYKFIGFNASSGFTATQNHENLNAITTTINVGATSNEVTITADIRKILKVDITMTASAKPRFTKEKYFEINKITVSANSFYSKTGSDDWLISDGTTDIKQSTKGTQTFYLLEGSTNITVTIESLSFIAHSPRDVKAPETTGCLTNDTKSPFTFTIKESNATIKWEGQQS